MVIGLTGSCDEKVKDILEIALLNPGEEEFKVAWFTEQDQEVYRIYFLKVALSFFPPGLFFFDSSDW